jgi:hypothetical protein
MARQCVSSVYELQSLEIALDAAAFESKNDHSQELSKGVEEIHTPVKRELSLLKPSADIATVDPYLRIIGFLRSHIKATALEAEPGFEYLVA